MIVMIAVSIVTSHFAQSLTSCIASKPLAVSGICAMVAPSTGMGHEIDSVSGYRSYYWDDGCTLYRPTDYDETTTPSCGSA